MRIVPENAVDRSLEHDDPEIEEMLYARHVEIENFKDLETQRGTPIPALFNQFYKYIQNPSSVSVETYKRMVDTDDTIGSGFDFLTTALASRFGRYQHKSKEVTEWVNARLDEIDGGFFNVVKEVLSATWAGFSVAEKVWANTENGFVPKKIIQLPPSTLLFETNRAGDITDDGILQYQRNYNPAFVQGGASYLFGFTAVAVPGDRSFRPDAYAKLGDFPFPLRTANTYSYLSIRIPKSKCIHYSFDAQGKFGNPYGRSLGRRIYKYYIMKDAILQMLATALDRKGTPLTLVYCDPSATVLDERKFVQGVSQQGQKNGIRADLAARRAFQNIHNDTTIFLPGKKGGMFEVEPVPQQSNANDFISALEFCNKGIMRGLLLPPLVFNGGDGGGAFALGQEHAKTFDKICDGVNSGAKYCILQQLVKEMIAYNFPRSAWEKDGVGDFAKKQLTADEIDKELSSIETAVNIGAIDMNDLNDLNKIRDKVGFEPRETPIPQPEMPSMDGEDPLFGGKKPPKPKGKGDNEQ